MELHPAQADFLDRKSKLAGFVGGRGTGKSTIGAYDLLKRSRPHRTYMVVAPTYPMLKDASLRSFMELGKRFGYVRSLNASDMRAELGNHATVLFRSADTPDRLRGPNLSGAWLDEASLIKREAFDVVIACLREGGEQGWLSSTFTPNGRNHWTYDVFGRHDAQAELFHATTLDNPFLPEEFYETVKHQYSGLRADQELGGLFVDIEGAEWPAEFFSADIWYTDEPEDVLFKAAAWDPSKGKGSKFGDYAAFVTVTLCRDGKFYIDARLSVVWPTHVQVQTAIEIQRRFQADMFGVEVNQFQELLVNDVMEASRRQDVVMPIYTIDNRVNKELRIRRLTPYLSQHQLRFKGGSPHTEILVNQMRDFPLGMHDDGPDALEMAVRLIVHHVGQTPERIAGHIGNMAGAY